VTLGLLDVAFLGAAGAFAAPPTDPYFANVSLLLHGDGANGTTTIVDSSPSPKTVTAVGNAQISTAQSKFGGASIAFDGTGDYLTSPSNAAFNYAAENFTIEGWFRLNNISSLQTVVSQASFNGSTVDGYAIRINNSKLGVPYYNNTGGPIFAVGDVSTLSSNTWYHFALTREGNVFRLFLNGALESTVTSSISIASNKTLYIGEWEGFTGRNINGYIDDLRITKGVARYTSNFTPPTAPFPDI